MVSAVTDQAIVNLMREGLGAKKIAQRLGIGLCSRRLQRLREANGIAKIAKAGPAISDATLIPLLRQGFGRKRIRAILGRDIKNERLTKIRDREGLVTQRPSGHVPEAELRALVMRGLNQLEIKNLTGIWVEFVRIKRVRRSMGVGRDTTRPKPSARDKSQSLFEIIGDALSHVRDPSIRGDAISEMCLAVIEGRLDLDQVTTEARRYGNVQIGKWQNKFGPRSLDESVRDDDWSLLDTLDDPTALAAFDRIFEGDAEYDD